MKLLETLRNNILIIIFMTLMLCITVLSLITAWASAAMAADLANVVQEKDQEIYNLKSIILKDGE